MAMALNYWLKYHAGCSVSWNGNQLRIPSPPPLPPTVRKNHILSLKLALRTPPHVFMCFLRLAGEIRRPI
jgi:hypothetical protein